MEQGGGADREQQLVQAAAAALAGLASARTEAERAVHLQAALGAAKALRSRKALADLGSLADRLRFHAAGPDDAALVATYAAQSLVDRGMPFAARDVLRASPRPTRGSLAWSEWHGLLGRVGKQIFFEAPMPTGPVAAAALEEALAAYLRPFKQDPRKATWHGVNLAALAARAERLGLPVPGAIGGAAAIGAKVRQALDGIPVGERDEWWHATYAEAALAAGDRAAFVDHAVAFAGSEGIDVFALESFLRQLTKFWGFGDAEDPETQRALRALHAAAQLRRPGGAVELPAAAVAEREPPSAEGVRALEEVFGHDAPKQIAWVRLGLERARSVASVCVPDGLGGWKRNGTGFLVAVRSEGAERRYVLTCAHVIGGLSEKGLRVRFEGVEGEPLFTVRAIAWRAPVVRHDAALLEPEALPDGAAPLPLAAELPPPAQSPLRRPRLYAIGHPLGGALSFSLQDNEMLDHEAPPVGKPGIPGVVRVHYRTPTKPGNSGSPVFIEDRWLAVALHHAGTFGRACLNGKPGSYDANEGIALASIAEAMRAEKMPLELVFG